MGQLTAAEKKQLERDGFIIKNGEYIEGSAFVGMPINATNKENLQQVQSLSPPAQKLSTWEQVKGTTNSNVMDSWAIRNAKIEDPYGAAYGYMDKDVSAKPVSSIYQGFDGDVGVKSLVKGYAPSNTTDSFLSTDDSNWGTIKDNWNNSGTLKQLGDGSVVKQGLVWNSKAGFGDYDNVGQYNSLNNLTGDKALSNKDFALGVQNENQSTANTIGLAQAGLGAASLVGNMWVANENRKIKEDALDYQKEQDAAATAKTDKFQRRLGGL